MDILKLLDSLGGGRNSARETWIAVCLGNPGAKYEHTRHNAGFLAADELAKQYGCRFRSVRKSLEAEFTLGDKRVILIKPQTYMNKSGEAVYAASSFYKVPPERVVVIYDDIALEPGILRVRTSGSAGGHNGMKSIIEYLDSEDFPRIRIGVGGKADARMDLADHVLGKPSETDMEKIRSAVKRAAEALPLVLNGQADRAQSLYCREK